MCTIGTRGDILPFLSLCEPFVKKGHGVTILTNRNWQTLVEDVGAEFCEIADPDPPQSARDDRKFYRTNVFPSFARSFSLIQKKIIPGASCVLIYRTNMVGAECAAEKFRIPSVKVALQPSAIRSVERPPWPFTSWVCGPLASAMKKVVIPAVFGLGELTAEYRNHTNRFRQEVGLPKRTFGKRPESDDLLLMLCPEWFAMPQKDWPGSSRVTGFLYFDGDRKDDELDAFVSTNGPPLVFTPGTGVSDARKFFAMAAELCRQLDMPGVFVSSSLHNVTAPVPGRILMREYAELHGLLPRSRLFVHHGGIGSIAQAIRAGVPQVILPDRFDQPDNALRVALLGLGGAVFSKSPGAQELEGFVRNVLGSTTVQRQVKRGAALVRAHPSNEVAYEMICGLMDRRFNPAHTAH